MKTLLFALVLPFGMFFSGEPMVETSDLNTPVEECYDLLKKVDVDVEIDVGRKKKGCSGFGVCGVVISAGVIKVIDGSGALGTLTVENGWATNLFIHRASLNQETYKKYFSSGVFVVGESFSATLNHRGQKIIFQLRAGKYPLKRTAKGFNIGMPPTLR